MGCGRGEPRLRQRKVGLRMTFRKRMVVGLGGAAAVVVVAGAAAFACTNLATLNLSSTAGKSGDTVTVTGSPFRVDRTDVTKSNPVVLHWNGVDGAVLAQTKPDKAGNISASFSVPDGQPGYYVLVATQRDAKGADSYGTPARASYQILGANGQSVVQPASTPSAAVGSDSSSAGIIALTVGLGALGLALLRARRSSQGPVGRSARAIGFAPASRSARRTGSSTPIRSYVGWRRNSCLRSAQGNRPTWLGPPSRPSRRCGHTSSGCAWRSVAADGAHSPGFPRQARAGRVSGTLTRSCG